TSPFVTTREIPVAKEHAAARDLMTGSYLRVGHRPAEAGDIPIRVRCVIVPRGGSSRHERGRQQMDPYTIGIAIKAVQALKKSLDAAALQERVEAIDEAVGAIGRHLTDGVVADVHAGFTHLEAAMTIAEPSVREDELRFARQIFNRLAQRSGNDQLLDDYTVMGAQHVAAMGHLGNYHYFLLRDQPEQALLSAYRCTEQFPALGVWLFPVELFSRDYRREVPGPHETRDP